MNAVGANSRAHVCPACGGNATLLDTIDFNKSCEELRGRFLPPSGLKIDYMLCEACGFCFAPGIACWTKEEFAERIYNDRYVEVDPDYLEARPKANAQAVASMFGKHVLAIRHLDYGGGNGLLSGTLYADGWDSQSYDPFVDGDVLPAGRFNLITCFEVFEHVPDIHGLADALATLLDDEGVVIFSTLVSDGRVARGERLTWWYAGPRNGHISLFSSRSLTLLGERHGMRFGSFSPNLHAWWRTLPGWAKPLVGAA